MSQPQPISLTHDLVTARELDATACPLLHGKLGGAFRSAAIHGDAERRRENRPDQPQHRSIISGEPGAGNHHAVTLARGLQRRANDVIQLAPQRCGTGREVEQFIAEPRPHAVARRQEVQAHAIAQKATRRVGRIFDPGELPGPGVARDVRSREREQRPHHVARGEERRQPARARPAQCAQEDGLHLIVARVRGDDSRIVLARHQNNRWQIEPVTGFPDMATVDFAREGLFALAMVIALALLGRAVAVYPVCLAFVRSRWAIPLNQQHLMWWGGLRGALALALALALPADLPRRDDILISAFAVVAFSVLVQGLTAPLALKALRLAPARRRPSSRDAPGRSR